MSQRYISPPYRRRTIHLSSLPQTLALLPSRCQANPPTGPKCTSTVAVVGIFGVGHVPTPRPQLPLGFDVSSNTWQHMAWVPAGADKDDRRSVCVLVTARGYGGGRNLTRFGRLSGV